METPICNIVLSVRMPLHSDPDSEYVVYFLAQIQSLEEEERKEKNMGYVAGFHVQVARMFDDSESVRLHMDGTAQDTSDCFATMFDPEKETLKASIEATFGAIGSDVLIISSVVVYPPYRGHRIGLAAVQRVVDVLGQGVGLVTLRPFPLQYSVRYEKNKAFQKKVGFIPAKEREASDLKRLQNHWKRLGFKPLGKTGWYALSPARIQPRVLMGARGLTTRLGMWLGPASFGSAASGDQHHPAR